MIEPNVTNSRNFLASTAASRFRTPEIFGSTVRRNAASSSAPINCGVFTPAPCKNRRDRAELAFDLRDRRAHGLPRPSRPRACSRNARRRRRSAQNFSRVPCPFSDRLRPMSASFTPVSRANASAHSAAMPLPPPVTSKTSSGPTEFSGVDLRRRKLREFQPGFKPAAVACEMNFRESVHRERFGDDPFDRFRNGAPAPARRGAMFF